MIAEAVVVRNHAVLMVRQHVQRGDIVWNFPGGGVNDSETAEQACIREVREETGYDIRLAGLLRETSGKLTYLAEIVGGQLCLDTEHEYNSDIIDVAWVDINDHPRFDAVTAPVMKLYCEASARTRRGSHRP